MNQLDEQKLNSMTLEEKVGQMIGLAFSGTEYSEELAMQVEEIKAGLIIYFKDNCANPKQIFELNKKINAQAKIAPFIALDQEGGMVARVTEGITQSPGAMAITACGKPENAYTLAYNMGRELRDIGFNFNFAPDADVNCNPKNPVINVRSYSEKPETVAKYVYLAAKGYDDAHLMTSLKHFPGHGDTAVDSHLGLPVVNFTRDRLEKMELVPFKMAKEQSLPGIMVSHVMFTEYDSTYPATLSKKLVQGLLREELGYDGLVVTDSLTMKAVFDRFSLEDIVLNGFNAGNDILLLCGAREIKMQKDFFDIAVRLVKEGKIPMSRVDESVRRILKYKRIYEVGKMENSFEDIAEDLCVKARVRKSEEVAEKSITLLKDENNLLPLKKEEKILVVFPKIHVVTLVENSDASLNSLSDYLPLPTDKFYISTDPTEDERTILMTKQKDYDKIIYCSYNACFNANQANLINELDQTKLLVIAVRTPYDALCLNAKSFVCSYEASPLAFKALSKVLTGAIKATGKMPVTLK
jgi:beta-N-acetylhexosaminidase